MSNLFDNMLSKQENLALFALYAVVAIIASVVAELFRRKIFAAFYLFTIAFLILLPINMAITVSSLFVKIKFIIVGCPYILISAALIGCISDQYAQESLSKINQSLVKFFKQCFKIKTNIPKKEFAVMYGNGTDDDTYGYSVWFSWFLYILIIINMLVAVAKEEHLTNAIAGVLYCLPLNIPVPIKSWTVSQKHEYYLYIDSKNGLYELRIFGISLLWIIGYTSWDICLLYHGGKWLVLWLVSIHLGIPLIRSLWKKRIDLYIHYRTFALGITLFINALRYMKQYNADDVEVTHDKMVYTIWGSINAVLAIINFCVQLYLFCKARKEASTSDDESKDQKAVAESAKRAELVEI
eukprot:262068_1